MKIAVVGAVLLLLGGVGIVTGVLPAAEAWAIAQRVWPILVFVVSITVVAELAAIAGVFDIAAFALARLGRGRTVVLWSLIVLLAVAATAFLSLDTTAVLLTPVVIAVARAHRLDPLPFAFTTVWLANTASLVLPVSNLTNLLAAEKSGITHPAEFTALLGPSAAVAIAVTVVLLFVVHRRALIGRYEPAAPPTVEDRPLLIVSGVVVVILAPLLVSGVAPWIPATAAAAVLCLVYLRRAPRTLRPQLLPWQLVVFASGLFVAVGVLQSAGTAGLIDAIAGRGESPLALLQLAGTGMLGANVVNNLPAYLALESVAHSPARIAALLIGVNAGPLVTPWASLATLLWHQRLSAVGLDVPWRRYVILGMICAPLTVAAATLVLAAR